VLSVLLGALARPTILAVFAAGVWVLCVGNILALDDGPATVLLTISRILNAVAVGYIVYSLVDVVDYYLGNLAGRTASRVDDVLAPLVGRSIRITVAALVVVNVAHVVSGKSVTTILAGLGVGGLAVALAAQDTIKNFFGSLVILGDKPFEIGDRVVVDGHDGPVEQVGFRSTKIRTLEGHLVTVPNAEIVNRTIQNIGKRPHIRRLANITITYDTPPDKVERALAIVREILKDHEGMDAEFPPRVFFSDFNDCSLNIMMLYWYHPPDYWAYMAFTERVNMEILRRFNAEGIEFAFPTQTLYLAGDPGRALTVRTVSAEAPGPRAG
ncbi:MAG: mechanosensitive ion channel family protein, partial [Lentisphaerae bacterium]|nr:mechanosensitive ion channel family protein [Lentisphaerota bacterium]